MFELTQYNIMTACLPRQIDYLLNPEFAQVCQVYRYSLQLVCSLQQKEITWQDHTAFNTFYNVLFLMLRITTSFIPFLSESLCQILNKHLRENKDKQEYSLFAFAHRRKSEANWSQVWKVVGKIQKVILSSRTIRERMNLPLKHIIKGLVVILDNNSREIPPAIEGKQAVHHRRSTSSSSSWPKEKIKYNNVHWLVKCIRRLKSKSILTKASKNRNALVSI